jgi:flagellar motor switch protein FliM
VLEVSVFKTTGTISMCIPYQVVQPILENLTSQVWFGGDSTRVVSKDARLQMGDRIGQVSLPLAVQLGETDMTVQELLDLRVGQVIRLNTNATGELPVLVDDHVKFMGQPGLSGKSLAVQIVRAADQES